jgi:hypothetical protein
MDIINSLDDDLKQKLAEKLTAGCQQEWQTMVSLDRDDQLTKAVAVAIDGESVPAGDASGIAFFAPDDLPAVSSNILLPGGYAVSPKGVHLTSVQEENGTIKTEVKLLTSTPFYVQSRDPGSGQVCLSYQLAHAWRSVWAKASRLNACTLADCFIFPDKDVSIKELLTYAHCCVRVAPFALADDQLSMSAVEILQKLFPHSNNGNNNIAGALYDFPAFRPFSEVRDLAAEHGVSPFLVRKYWKRQGLIREGNSAVTRQGSGSDTARMVIFTSKVLEFLRQLPTEIS